MLINSFEPQGVEKLKKYLSGRRHRKGDGIWIWSNDQISEFLLDPNKLWCGLIKNDEIVGFVLFNHMELAREVLYLETHPQQLRKGFMLELMEQFLKESKVNEIWVDVHVQNQGALNLYLRLGFAEVGRRKAYYQDGADSLLMTYTPNELHSGS